jgi:acyl-CoA synthetase (AMP-forming)/AMP-acid ligase II
MVTVTQAVLAAASGQGPKPAVVDAVDGHSVTYSDLEAFVPFAAARLAERGVRPGDAVALHIPPGGDHTLARHALTAAGAVIVHARRATTAAELAEALRHNGVRIIVTAPGLTEVAVAAAERSYVRQVLTLADLATSPSERVAPANVPATPTPLGDGRLDRLRARLASTAADHSDIVVARLHDLPPEECDDVTDVALLLGATLVVVPAGARILTSAATGYPMRAIDLYSR